MTYKYPRKSTSIRLSGDKRVALLCFLEFCLEVVKVRSDLSALFFYLLLAVGFLGLAHLLAGFLLHLLLQLLSRFDLGGDLGSAAYLFIVNAYFIFLASAVILVVLKTPKVRQLTEKEWKKMRINMIRDTLIILILSLILGYFMLTGQ